LGAAGDRVATLISDALRCHKAGDLGQAERLYRLVLKGDPGREDIWNLLGVVAVQTGRPEEAVGSIGRAVRINGANPEFHYNLGLAHLALRDRDKAVECLRRAISLRSDYADALINLGNLLLNGNELEEAEACYRKAAKLAPSNPMIHNNLGTVLMAKQAIEEAEPCFREALKLKPDFAEAHNGLGLTLGASGKFDEAIESFQAALRLNPKYAQAYNNLANIYFDQDRLEDAEVSLRKAIEFRSNYTQAEGKLAAVYIEQSNFEPALAYFERLLERDPDSKAGWAGKANVLDRMRRSREAHEIVRRFAQDGLPPLGMVHLYANLAKKEHRQAEVIAELEGMLGQCEQKDEQRRLLHFTIGDLYDELGAFEEAFTHYSEGNRLRPTPFDSQTNANRVDQIIEYFSAKRLKELPRADNQSELPVFIIGMPRSGTSLVEQILSCHGDVYAAGELKDIGKLGERLGFNFASLQDGTIGQLRLDKESVNAAADRHLEKLRKQAENATRVTDKMPYNFWNLGLIAFLYPNARIIHCVRNPIDTCLSCYFQNFARGNFFSFDLRHAGLFHRHYQRLMAHWKGVLDLPMLEVQYEEHVAEPERVCREMLEFLELDWDPACLRFHESRRYTKTASRDQVRKPIYSSSAGRWEKYEPYLGPLKEGLAGTDSKDQ
jgi:tetratricopeptide (TPR) repeat protein